PHACRRALYRRRQAASRAGRAAILLSDLYRLFDRQRRRPPAAGFDRSAHGCNVGEQRLDGLGAEILPSTYNKFRLSNRARLPTLNVCDDAAFGLAAIADAWERLCLAIRPRTNSST